MKDVGICGRGRSPTPRRSLPDVYTRTSASTLGRCPHNCGHLGSRPQWLAKRKGQPLRDSSVVGEDHHGLPRLLAFALGGLSLRVLSNFFSTSLLVTKFVTKIFCA